MRFSHILLSVLAATAVPASAHGQPLPGFACQAAPDGGQHTICVKGHVQLVPVGAATGTVVAVCEAVVQGAVTATIAGCEIVALAGGVYARAQNRALPGVAAVTHIVATVPVQPYQLCVVASYVATDGTLADPANEWATRHCFTSLV